MAKTKWVLETGVSGMTNGALVTSLLRYGFVISGSCIPLGLMAEKEKHLTNAAERRIGGMERATGIETLRFLPAIMSFKNMYIVHCEGPVDSALRANGSSIAVRLRRELAAILRADAMDVA